MQDELAKAGRWFPPVPTYLGAFAGGAVATCAAGAATFKYGTVREWVEGLTVVLAGGDVLELSRGECIASADGVFEIETASGERIIRLPDHFGCRTCRSDRPATYIAPGMDLIDLFIGSEGTLGVIAEATFRTAPLPAGVCRALVPVPSRGPGDRAGRRTARRPRSRPGVPAIRVGIDVAAIEHIDARSIAVIREDGVDRKLNITLPSGAAVVLLIDLELSPAGRGTRPVAASSSRCATPTPPDSPLVRFCRMLDRRGVLDDTEIALPGRSRARGRVCRAARSRAGRRQSPRRAGEAEPIRRSRRPPPT